MAKKRSCRRTVNEDKVHEKAVKIRKMTDEQSWCSMSMTEWKKPEVRDLIRERNRLPE